MMPNDHFKDFYITKEFLWELVLGTIFGILLGVMFVLCELFILLVRFYTRMSRKFARGGTLTPKKDLK